MEGLVDYARRQIKCPECRAEHRIPYNGVQSFPNNVTLARFLDLHRGITGEEPEPLPSQMDRCGVCGEKSFCLRCAHCEKKVCEECRTAHLDILRREINRINTQVRRGLSKLTEQAEQTGKSSERLILISSQIRDEITESVRRLIKDLKDKETKLLADLDEFTQSESKNSEKLNEDLETELVTITSNCELVEDHVTEQDEWTDAELMEYKDIFLKTLEFLRNLDPDTTDLSRKIKYVQKVDLDNLRRTAADFGEIKITAPASGLLTGGLLSPSDSSSNLAVPGSNLTRSQSDHRLAAQFANSGRTTKDALQRSYLDVSGGNRYGSDSERERASSPPGRRGERFGSVRSYGARGSENTSNFSYTRGWERPGDSEYEPSNSSNFRSRFMRERIRERGGAAEDHSFEEHDSDVTSSHRVRFQEEASAQTHQKLFDTEEMVNLRAPLSGIIKLLDSPHVMERLHQNEVKAKQREVEAKENGSSNNPVPTSTPTVPTSTPAPPRPSRQISEDEIEKQKKQNKAAEAAQQSSQSTNNASATSPPAAPNPTPTPKSTSNSRSSSLAVESSAASGRNPTSPTASVTNRRVQALQKEDTRSIRSTSSDDGATSGPESGDVTCDDETPSATSAAASAALNSASRRRMYASTHSSSGGGTGTGSLANSMSASVDFASDPSATGRSKPLSAQAPATNRQVPSSSISTSSSSTNTSNNTSNNSPNSISSLRGNASRSKGKDSNNNYTNEHLDKSPSSPHPSRSPFSPSRAPVSAVSNSSSYSTPSSYSSKDFNSSRPSQVNLSSSSSASSTPYSSSSSSSKSKYSNGSGAGGGSAISDYLLGSDLLDRDTSSSHHWGSSTYEPAYSSSRLNAAEKSSASSLHGVGSPTSRHNPTSYSSTANSGTGSSAFSSSLSSLPYSSASTNSNYSNWRDHANPLNSSSSHFGPNATSSSSVLNSLALDPSSGATFMPAGSNLAIAPAIGANTSPNQSTELILLPNTLTDNDDSLRCLAKPAVPNCSHSSADASDEPSASGRWSRGLCTPAEPPIDDRHTRDTSHDKHLTADGEVALFLDGNTERIHTDSPLSPSSNNGTSTQNTGGKRTIRIKRKLPVGEGTCATTSVPTSKAYSPRDFKGQDKPDYTPFRQARASLSTGSTFSGIPSNLAVSSTSLSHVSLYRPSVDPVFMATHLPSGSLSSRAISIAPTYVGSSSIATTSSYRHTLSTMGFPSSSNATHLLRAIAGSRLATAEFVHSDITRAGAILELADSITSLFFWLCEVSLVMALIGLTLLTITVPDSISQMGPTTMHSPESHAGSNNSQAIRSRVELADGDDQVADQIKSAP